MEAPNDHAHSTSSNASASSLPPEEQSPGQQQQQQLQKQSAVLARCLKLLSGDSDEHKFAGLVMVTKHVPALTASSATGGSTGRGEEGSSSEAGQLRQICNAVGPNFVHRLLRTAEDGGGSSGSRDGNQTRVIGGASGLSVYQQISLGVLAAFLRDESLVERFIPVAPALVRAIRAANAITQAQALSDALDCAQALAGLAGGTERLLRAGAAAAVVARLVAASVERTSRHQKSTQSGGGGVEETKGSAGDATRKDFCSTPAGLGESDAMVRAEVTAFAFVARALEASSGNCLGARELTNIAQAFRDDPTPVKFEFMDLLLRWAVLQEGDGDMCADSVGAWTSQGPFPAALREGLLQALHGAAKDKHRDSALALLASLLRALGQEWAVEEEAEAGTATVREQGNRGSARDLSSAGKTMARERGTFVAFAIRCAAGEVRILLDECVSTLLPGVAGAATGQDKAETESVVREKARGPMSPAGLDPSIGAAVETAAAAPVSNSDDDENVEYKTNIGDVSWSTRAPLSTAERKHAREKRIARLMRMVPVGLGIVESTIAFLCRGTDGGEGESTDASHDNCKRVAAGSWYWDELPSKTLLDLQKTLTGLFGCVFDFFTEIRPWIVSDDLAASGSGRGPSPSMLDLWTVQRVGLACSHALGVWVAEDPECLPQRFMDTLPMMLALRADPEAPDSDDEEREDESERDAVVPTMASLAAFPGASRYVAGPSFQGSTTVADEALHNILRALLALSYEPAPLAVMVEQGVTARLGRLAFDGSAAIAALIAAGAAATPPVPPPEQASEAVRSPLVTACGLLTNILNSAGHLPWPQTGAVLRWVAVRAGKKGELCAPRALSHPVLAHPETGECLVSLAEVAGLAGAARRAGGGARWRLLAGQATLVIMIVACSGLSPGDGLVDRRSRWGQEGEVRREDRSRTAPSVWGSMAQAVDEALGSLSPAPGRGLIGAGDEEEASYEEGAIWQWCLECATAIEAEAYGADENPYVATGIMPRKVLRSLGEASADGRI